MASQEQQVNPNFSVDALLREAISGKKSPQSVVDVLLKETITSGAIATPEMSGMPFAMMRQPFPGAQTPQAEEDRQELRKKFFRRLLGME